ncbi:lipopolysaccharide/colanic/teichoic acid biosynthesis glycosyltransferase [Pseudonocardia sediminis]|uniref:Lipopolysaccharide/colanic/teichoic acid biosynthesis glycosyltransferase n=2 Tax=Pseudonocardia sediminis TaxID=1397368 RepID=A0A4Q7V5E7_PSEST|nr:lipopolysaccharide/colanic/teichoic acid biosynthesis glycosyltransferase [Pseudonocardia sediminis]
MTLRREAGRPVRPCGRLARVLDVTLGSLLLILILPVLLVIVILIRIDSDGPALFRQRRVGESRREFTLFKFRTMVQGGDDSRHREQIAREIQGEDTSVGGSWKLDDDPRVTGIGDFLRRTSIDELPQLINVVRGDMTLVGPRPCLPWEADIFPPRYRGRFAVRPGLTGLWQVSGRSTMGTLEMLELDLRYVDTRTPTTDLKILIRTVPALLRDGSSR